MTSLKKIVNTFLSLSVIQLLNIALPLATIPYVSRVIGIDGVGRVALATAVTAWLCILVDYGFSITATRAAAKCRADKVALGFLYSSITTIKILLGVAAFVVLNILVVAVKEYRADASLFYISFLSVLAQCISPLWLFQGIECLQTVTKGIVYIRVLFSAAIFVFVSERDDLTVYAFMGPGALLASSIYATAKMFSTCEVSLALSGPRDLRALVRDGFYVFLTTMYGCIYSYGSIVILGMFSSAQVLGAYATAQKMVAAGASILQMVPQAIFPRLVSLMEAQDTEIVRRFIIRAGFVLLAVNAVSISIIFPYADQIYDLIVGMSDGTGEYCLQAWLLISVITVANVYLNMVLLALGKDRNVSWVYLLAAFVFAPVALYATSVESYRGMIWAMAMVEIIVLSGYLYVLKRLQAERSVRRG